MKTGVPNFNEKPQGYLRCVVGCGNQVLPHGDPGKAAEFRVGGTGHKPCAAAALGHFCVL